MENNNNKKGNVPPKNNKTPNKKPFSFYWIYAIVGIVLLSLQLLNWSGGSSVITEAEFQEMVMQGDVDQVVVVKTKVLLELPLPKKLYLKKNMLKK